MVSTTSTGTAGTGRERQILKCQLCGWTWDTDYGIVANECANCHHRPLGWLSWREGDPNAPEVVHDSMSNGGFASGNTPLPAPGGEPPLSDGRKT